METSLGIDIGKYSIKLAVIESQSQKSKLVRYQEFPLSQNPNHDTELEIIDILRQISSDYPHSSDTKVSFALPQGDVSMSLCDFPFKERHKILKSLAFELEDDIPFSPESAIFDAKITAYHPSASDVLAVATPSNNVRVQLQKAVDGNLDLTKLNCQAFAFFNLFENWMDSPPQARPTANFNDDDDENTEFTNYASAAAQVILNIGHSSSFALIIKGQQLLDICSFDWGGQHMFEFVANKMNMQTHEAMKRIHLKPFIYINEDDSHDAESLQISRLMLESLGQFSSKLRLSLLEVSTRLNLKLESVHLCGGLALIKNIGPAITQHTELSCNRLAHFNMEPNVDIQAELSSEQLMTCGVALGLAMDGIKRPKNPAINFLKEEFAKQNQAFTKFIYKWSYALRMLALFFVTFLVYAMIRESLSLDMADRASQTLKKQAKAVAKLKGRKANMSGVKKYIRKQKKLLKNIELAENIQNINSSLDFVKLVSDSSPRAAQLKMNIKNFELSDNKLRIFGEIERNSSLRSLENGLKSLTAKGKIRKIPASGVRPQSNWRSFGYELNIKKEGVAL